MRRRVFISGPISRGNLAENVNRGTAAFLELARAGFAPFCPHWSVYSSPCWLATDGVVVARGTVHGNSEMGHDDWLAVDLPWVVASDAVLRLPGESRGADVEVEFARAHGIPVFHAVADVIAWGAA